MIKFLTIRETAETGIFTEWGLRKMLKNGKLPGVFSGTRFYVNYSELEKMLAEQSRVNAGGQIVSRWHDMRPIPNGIPRARQKSRRGIL